MFLDVQKVLKECLAMEKTRSKQKAPAESMQALEQEIDKRNRQCTDLYADYKEGILTRDEYVYAKKRYLDEIQGMKRQLSEQKGVRKKMEKLVDGEQKWSQLIEQYYLADRVSAEMIQAMVKSMTLDTDNSISIEFRYMDEFEKMLAACKKYREAA